jgi:hypothetical protein
MSKLLDAIDELNRGQNLVTAAFMAIRGSALGLAELKAMDPHPWRGTASAEGR